MRRHKNLIPLSRQHHQMLILAQVLKSDVPAYKDMPSTVSAKTEFLNEKLENLILPNFKMHRNHLYPALIDWAFADTPLMNEVATMENELVEDIVAQKQHDEDSLDLIGQAIEQLVRKKERFLYHAMQEQCGKQLDSFELADV